MHSVSVKTAGKQLPDTEIARRVALGDRDAFELLMRRYNQLLYRTARSILKDDAGAEDAVREAYMLAYRAIGAFRGDAQLSTWLIRIVVSEASARARKHGRSAEVIRLSSGEPEADADVSEDNLNVVTAEPHTAVRALTRRLLEEKIDALPDAFRTVFVLRALEELTLEETAATLGIPAATVRTRFLRGKGLLREALAREIDFAYGDAFAFAGGRCDRIVAGVLGRLNDVQARDA